MSTSEIPERQIGTDDDGPIMRRAMTPEMVEERVRLNSENTAGRIAARAAAARAKLNGHSNGNGKLPEGALH